MSGKDSADARAAAYEAARDYDCTLCGREGSTGLCEAHSEEASRELAKLRRDWTWLTGCVEHLQSLAWTDSPTQEALDTRAEVAQAVRRILQPFGVRL